MNLNDYQNFTKTTAVYPPTRALDYLGLGLVSEAGEVAGKLKKRIRDGGTDVMSVIDELGDVLWYVTRLCDEFGFSVEECFARNMLKLQDRKNRGVIQGNGDTR